MFNINSTLSRRNFLAGAAALGSTAALAGCSSGGSDGGTADDGKTFKIGVIGPLTGAAATYGVSAEKGAKLAAKDFSTKDLKLSLKSEDDVADGEKAINAFNTLCDWGMQALVGPVTTGAAVAVSGEIADDMLMVTPSASSLDVTKDKTTVFQVCFTDPTMGASAAKFLAEKYADAKIALFYNSGDTYSSGVADAFAEQAKESKLDIVDTETFKDDSSTSFTNQLTKAKEAGATLIFAPIYYTPASVLITAIGVSYFLQNAAQLLWGATPKNFTSLVTFQVPEFLAKFNVSAVSLVTIVACLVIMAGLMFFTGKTKMGKAMRAVSEDKAAAQLMGINVNRTISMTFAIGSALAAIAGVLLCSYSPVLQPTTGAMPGIKAFDAAVFGGIGSIPCAFVGGILTGIIEAMAQAYISTSLANSIVFGVLIIVLLVKPAGLLGKYVPEKV